MKKFDYDLLVASNNSGKIKEIKEILGGHFNRVISPKELGLDFDVEETEDTYVGNARLKARHVCALSGLPVIADDSGLEVDALGGLPGVKSARYADEHATDLQNTNKLLTALEGVKERGARFRSCVLLMFPNGEEYVGDGVTEGKILTEITGENGFGYDPVFFSDDLCESFGTADAMKKNRVSHRYRALQDLVTKLK